MREKERERDVGLFTTRVKRVFKQTTTTTHRFNKFDLIARNVNSIDDAEIAYIYRFLSVIYLLYILNKFSHA